MEEGDGVKQDWSISYQGSWAKEQIILILSTARFSTSISENTVMQCVNCSELLWVLLYDLKYFLDRKEAEDERQFNVVIHGLSSVISKGNPDRLLRLRHLSFAEFLGDT
jgi:hypothetical protein